MKQELSVTKATVTVNMLQVGAKNMTHQIFTQIAIKYAFDNKYNFIGDDFLGYRIYRIDLDYYNEFGRNPKNHQWLLWVDNGELRRCTLFYVARGATRDEKIYLDVNKDSSFDIRKMSDDERLNAIQKIKTARCFMESIKDKQIYI